MPEQEDCNFLLLQMPAGWVTYKNIKVRVKVWNSGIKINCAFDICRTTTERPGTQGNSTVKEFFFITWYPLICR